MQCLIVAAGQGLRLRSLGASKPLAELAGKPLIAHVLSRAKAGGLKDFVVVTGYEAERLEGFVKPFAERHGLNVTFVRNPDYEKPNGLSVLAARHALKSPFVLAMCDHLIEPDATRAVAGLPLGRAGMILATDSNLANPLVDKADATKVKTAGRNIVAIGKDLTDFDCYDTGLFLGSTALLDAIEASGRLGDPSISGGVRRLAAEGRALSHDATGSFWIDVDSPAMFKLAEARLGKK